MRSKIFLKLFSTITCMIFFVVSCSPANMPIQTIIDTKANNISDDKNIEEVTQQTPEDVIEQLDPETRKLFSILTNSYKSYKIPKTYINKGISQSPTFPGLSSKITNPAPTGTNFANAGFPINGQTIKINAITDGTFNITFRHRGGFLYNFTFNGTFDQDNLLSTEGSNFTIPADTTCSTITAIDATKGYSNPLPITGKIKILRETTGDKVRFTFDAFTTSSDCYGASNDKFSFASFELTFPLPCTCGNEAKQLKDDLTAFHKELLALKNWISSNETNFNFSQSGLTLGQQFSVKAMKIAYDTADSSIKPALVTAIDDILSHTSKILYGVAVGSTLIGISLMLPFGGVAAVPLLFEMNLMTDVILGYLSASTVAPLTVILVSSAFIT